MTIIGKHIDNILNDKLSLLDHKMLERYFTDDALNREVMPVIKEKWEHFAPGPEVPRNLDHAYYKLWHTIYQKKEKPASKGTKLFLKLSRIAAVLIIGILSLTCIYLYHKGNVPASNQQAEFISHSGFRNQFKLPDGTTGWLGYGTELKYHVNDDDQRIVDLNGLAFFDVMHENDRPFIVKTPARLDIEVLGTRFNVSSYSADSSCEIVLEQGSVKLNLPNRESEHMAPNDRVVYHSYHRSIEKTKVDVADFLAWKEGVLILKDVSLSEACVKLSRFYNVEFDLQTEGRHRQKIRMTLKDDPLEDALKLLTILSPVTWRTEERKVLDDNSYSRKKIIIKNK